MKRSTLLILFFLIAILLIGLIICLSFASNKGQSGVKLVSDNYSALLRQ